MRDAPSQRRTQALRAAAQGGRPHSGSAQASAVSSLGAQARPRSSWQSTRRCCRGTPRARYSRRWSSPPGSSTTWSPTLRCGGGGCTAPASEARAASWTRRTARPSRRGCWTSRPRTTSPPPPSCPPSTIASPGASACGVAQGKAAHESPRPPRRHGSGPPPMAYTRSAGGPERVNRRCRTVCGSRRRLLPRLQSVPGASYTFVTGGGNEDARSAIGQVNAQAVWGLAAALRNELRDSEVKLREVCNLPRSRRLGPAHGGRGHPHPRAPEPPRAPRAAARADVLTVLAALNSAGARGPQVQPEARGAPSRPARHPPVPRPGRHLRGHRGQR